MKIPFTIEQFQEVFRNYNLSAWPLQIIFYLLAVIIILVSLKKFYHSGKIIFSILSFFWIWMGIVYHLIYFTEINKAAYIFGSAFVLQGFFFLYSAFSGKNISFLVRPGIYGITGTIFILFALIIYPALGYLQGHIYPDSPTFGLPCPTTIFTFGVLLWVEKKAPVFLIIIPAIWSLIGFSAAIQLGIKEDIGLLVSGLLFIFLVANRNKQLLNNKT